MANSSFIVVVYYDARRAALDPFTKYPPDSTINVMLVIADVLRHCPCVLMPACEYVDVLLFDDPPNEKELL